MTTQPRIVPGSIVVAVDGSKHAARAVQWAAEQADLEHRSLVVLHAAGEGDVRSAAWAGVDVRRSSALPDILHSARAVVDDAVELAHSIRPGLTIEALPLIGDPRQVLVDVSPRAHLIVMGSRGRGVFRSMFLGSVSAAVSRHAACPVAVCRPIPTDVVTHGVVVGADGAPESQPVLELAFQQASFRGLQLTVLHCFWDVAAAVSGVHHEPVDAGPQEDLRLLLSEAVAGLSEKYPDVQVNLRLAHGLVDEALATLSEQWSVVVVGRHPVRSISRLLTGSLATAVLERANSTVVIVPEPEPAPTEDRDRHPDRNGHGT
jgi:nucleotide-binding universal stress UspA family protein